MSSVECDTTSPEYDATINLNAIADLASYMNKTGRFPREFYAALGRSGGKQGGKKCLVTMTPEERRKRASEAAKARWEKRRRELTTITE